MNSTSVKTYAKLNLSLEITGVKDGYHMLDSLVASIDISDTIRLRKRKDKLVNVAMHGQGSEGIPPEKNVAQKAAEAFIERYDTTGADISVYKDIPMGGGIGGSSADAAGVLNGMAKLYGVTDEKGLKELADSLGSDTGYMLQGGFARMTGRGEQVWRLPVCPTLYFLLLCPSSPVSTAECYKRYDELQGNQNGATQSCIDYLLDGKYSDMGASFYNALYAPACKINQDVEQAINDLKVLSPTGLGMTGSGSCVFAMFETRELCEWAKSRYKGKARALVVKTIDPQDKKTGLFERLKSPFFLSEEEINATK